MKLSDFTNKIRSVGNNLIQDYISTGHVLTGINGPYDDPETEVRYLAHLIVIASVECLKYGNEDYRSLVSKMGDQLLSMQQGNGLYKMRQKSGKDECNGTIGHAWLVEGFLYAYKVSGDEKYLEESERIFLMHDFNQKLCLWGRPLMGRDDNAIDYTFNHQLWYAASLAEFLQVRDNMMLYDQLRLFLSRISRTITINADGRIAHAIYGRISAIDAFKHIIARFRDVMAERLKHPSLRYKEVGYHIFNLMAFARIYKVYPDCTFFHSSIFKKAANYISSDIYLTELQADNIQMDSCPHGDTLSVEEKSINIYGLPYNVPGFEIMYCNKVFGNMIDEKRSLLILDTQIDQTYNSQDKMFGIKCHDKVSVNYRVYEYYRYLEIE